MKSTTTVPSLAWLEVVRRAVEASGGTPTAAEVVWAARDCPGALALATAMAELSLYALAPATGDVVDLEVEAVEVAHRVIRPLLEAKFQARLDDLDERLAGQSQCPRCGGRAESQGRLARGWSGVVGKLRLRRRYRYCPDCEAGFAPAQQALGLPAGDFTPRLEEACTMMTTTVSHGMAQELLASLLGVVVSVRALEDMTERRAVAVQRAQAADAVTCAPFDATGLPAVTTVRPADAVLATAAPRRAYLEVDGVAALTRQERTGAALTATEQRRQRRAREEGARGGKGRRYRTLGKEVKNAVLYDAADCAKEGARRGCLLHKTYVSHLGDWATFAQLLWVALVRLRFDQVQELVILGDGAEWIRSLAAWLPIPCRLILDLYHVKRRIWEVAHSHYGEHSAAAAAWAVRQCAAVEAGQAPAVITALHRLRPRTAETKELIAALAGWLHNNRDRMDYPAYRARGLRVSSSAVESANFHVTGQRLKVQGTRWSEEGASQMATLRADLFNGWWERRTKDLLAN